MADKMEQKDPSNMIDIPDTVAGQLWQQVKGLDLNLFSLPDQLVSKYFHPLFVEADKVYLTTTVSAAVAALEEVLPKDLEITSVVKYFILAKKVQKFGG